MRHVPCALHTVSQPDPVEHGLHEQTDVLKLQTPLPLQLSGQGPTPDTPDGKSVSSVLPTTSAARTLRTVRPADFSMVGPPELGRADNRLQTLADFPDDCLAF